MLNDNPLLVDSSTPPRFDSIEVDHIEPAISAVLEECRKEFHAIESGATPTWDGVVSPLERLSDRLGYTWGIVDHLMSVKNSQELREVYERLEPKVVAFRNRNRSESPGLRRPLRPARR